MVRIHNKISLVLELLQYFTMREWHFPCPNFDAIHTILSKEENELYLTYKEDFDVEKYLHQAMETGLKEDHSTMHINRMYHKFLYVLDTLVKVVFWCFVLSLLVAWWEPLRNLLALGEPVVQYLPFLGSAVLKNKY